MWDTISGRVALIGSRHILARSIVNFVNFRGLDSGEAESYLHDIPFHRFPAAHSCARRFFV
jgi:hypothetical protein